MTKGYWIARMDIHDPGTYGQYIAANAEPIARFGGRFLIRAGKQELVEGAARMRTAVIEFPSYQAALDCYNDPAYQEAKAIRDPVSSGDILVIEGYDGPQPGD